jgi:glutamate 5-kinase
MRCSTRDQMTDPRSPSAASLSSARTLVVKVGSALLVDPRLGAGLEDVDRGWLGRFAADVGRMRARGQVVVVVSSGAVALGRRRLGLGRRTLMLDEKQAAAAAGQSLLMRAWEEALAPVGAVAAQILLTRDDTETRRRWLNARATVRTLLDLGAVPVVNENDTVATEEIRYGDNDRLAARVAQMVGADLLVLLSDVDGVYTADPRRDPQARHISQVDAFTPELDAMAEGANLADGVGTGGMATKIAAARIAADAGCATLVGLGRPAAGDGGPLSAIEDGARASLIHSSRSPLAAYKSWIAGGLAPMGEVVIDDGAVAALMGGKSLLPSGVREVRGQFGKGDPVSVLDAEGREVARGLAGYDADAARRIRGLRSDAIEAALGYSDRPVLIHRNDLVLR